MTTAEILAERYGAPAPWRRKALIGAVVFVAVVFGGWLAWTTIEQSDPRVQSTLVGFSVDGQNLAKATVNVQFRNTGVTDAECSLQALAADHSIVGVFAFHPQPQSQVQTYVEQIHTERQASSVTLVGCTADGQGRPR